MSENVFKESVAAERLGRDPLGAHLDSVVRSLVDLGVVVRPAAGDGEELPGLDVEISKWLEAARSIKRL